MATVCHEDEHVEEMLKRREKDRPNMVLTWVAVKIMILFGAP